MKKLIIIIFFALTTISLAQAGLNRIIRYNMLDSILAARGYIDTTTYTLVELPDQEPGVLIGRNSDNSTDWWGLQTLLDSLANLLITDSSGLTTGQIYFDSNGILRRKY